MQACQSLSQQQHVSPCGDVCTSPERFPTINIRTCLTKSLELHAKDVWSLTDSCCPTDDLRDFRRLTVAGELKRFHVIIVDVINQARIRDIGRHRETHLEAQVSISIPGTITVFTSTVNCFPEHYQLIEAIRAVGFGELLHQDTEIFVRISLDSRGREFLEIFWTLLVHSSVQCVNDIVRPVRIEVRPGAVNPVLLHEMLQSTRCALVNLLVAFMVYGTQVVIKCWEMHQALHQRMSIAVVSRIIHASWPGPRHLSRPPGDATVPFEYVWWNRRTWTFEFILSLAAELHSSGILLENEKSLRWVC